MNLLFRLFYTLLYAAWQGEGRITERNTLHFRTWFHDLDLNLHMNNGRYLTLMDLGRMQLMQRAGFMGRILKREWMPVIGGVQIRFRRSLRPWQRFQLHTRIVSWDEKWVYIEQVFESDNQVMASAMVRGLIRDRKGSIPTPQLLQIMGEELESPSPPPKMEF